MWHLLPRDEEFFELFLEVAKLGHEAAGHLHNLFTGPADRAAYCVEQIKLLEHDADQVTHEVVNRLDRTFITPIDREDIHMLASDLDDVIDRMDGTARRAQIFRLGRAPEGVGRLTTVIHQITAVMVDAVGKLRENTDVIRLCVEAKRLEEVGDAIYHEMLGKLFDEEKNPIELIKWKEIYDTLETTIDEAEDVANDLESIALKHA
jgi:uncharacterized protein